METKIKQDPILIIEGPVDIYSYKSLPTFDPMVMTFFFVSISIIHYDRPTEALEAIQERKARLDLVLTDVYKPLFL